MADKHERVLLTGASGFLGHYLAARLAERAVDLVLAGRGSRDLWLDLEDLDGVEDRVRRVRPDLVLHAAALTSIAGCELDPEKADRVNHLASARLARACAGQMILISTDLVFDGCNPPYSSEDAPRPLSGYGASKARAEEAVIQEGGTVVRVPLLFGPSFDGRRGATDMIAGADGVVGLFTNEYRSPLHAADAAHGIVELALGERVAGIFHVAGSERVSRYELGARFLAAGGRDVTRIRPTESSDPKRPPDVSMKSDWVCARSLDEALRDSWRARA